MKYIMMVFYQIKIKIDRRVINWVVIFGSKKERLHNRVVHK